MTLTFQGHVTSSVMSQFVSPYAISHWSFVNEIKTTVLVILRS